MGVDGPTSVRLKLPTVGNDLSVSFLTLMQLSAPPLVVGHSEGKSPFLTLGVLGFPGCQVEPSEVTVFI